MATSTRTANRHIVEGTLGCPVCKATFAIVDGEARFGSSASLLSTRVLDDDASFRLAAQLHLVEAPLPILLVGGWSRAVTPLRRIVPHVTMFVGDARTVVTQDERVSALRLPLRGIPLASGALRGVALDADHSGADWCDESARVMCSGGRLVVPAAHELDEALWRVLARDDTATVAERLPTASAPVTLRRAPKAPLFEG